MRVFLFKSGGLGDEYGIGSYIKSVCNASGRHPLPVTFIVVELNMTSSIEPIKITKRKNITFCKIPVTYNGISTYADALFPSAIYATLCDLFSLDEKDIFHFNSSMLFPLAKKILEELDPMIVYTVHFLIWKSVYQNNQAAFLKEFRQKEHKDKLISIHYEKDICKISKRVICMNSETSDYLKGVYRIPKGQILMLPNGLPENGDYTAGEPVSVIKERLGLTGKKIVLYVGRIHVEKGVFDLISVFKEIVADVKGVKLVIVGDGAISQAISLCNGIWSDVLFTGYIKDRKQLMEFYKIADLMVLPSYHEQSSFTFLEAIQNKKPLILSSIPAFEKMDERACRKVSFIKKRGVDQSVINRKQLQKEIRLLLADRKGANRLAEHAFRTFKEEFNLDILYDELVRKGYKAGFAEGM